MGFVFEMECKSCNSIFILKKVEEDVTEQNQLEGKIKNNYWDRVDK